MKNTIIVMFAMIFFSTAFLSCYTTQRVTRHTDEEVLDNNTEKVLDYNTFAKYYVNEICSEKCDNLRPSCYFALQAKDKQFYKKNCEEHFSCFQNFRRKHFK